MEQVQININGKKRTIGYLYPEEKMFRKYVKLSRNLFRKLDAWDLDNDFFQAQLRPENYTIHVYDEEEGIVYQATAQDFVDNGSYLSFKNNNGMQILLPRKFWKTKIIRQWKGS